MPAIIEKFDSREATVGIDSPSVDLQFMVLGTEDWEITFSFAASPNATGLTMGDITDIDKKGWEYLWVRYQDAEDEETLIKQPVAAYVERVYEFGNFALLGIGV